MTRWAWAGLLSLVLLCLGAGPLTAGEAEYLVSGEVRPVVVDANGYHQKVVQEGPGTWRVTVTVSWRPVGATGGLAAGRRSPQREIPEGFDLPPPLRHRVERETDPWEAATTVLRWVGAHVAVDEDDPAPQDARSVLHRRRGRCSGVANLTAALLLTAGFEARTVSGILVSDEGPVPHRWVECRLPGAGWVPTDPTLGLWVVTARHVACTGPAVSAVAVTVVRGGREVLPSLPRDARLPVRPNRGASLACRLEGFESGVAVLDAGDGRTLRTVLDPVGHFDEVLPGRWTLTVEADGRVVERRRLDLAGGSSHSLIVGGGAGLDGRGGLL